MKTQKICLSLLSIAFLVACASGAKGGNKPGQQKTGLIKITDFGTDRLEAENFNTIDWVSDPSYNGDVLIENENASGGYYLAAAARNTEGTATFKFELAKYSKVVFSAAYCQMEEYLDDVIDLTKTYRYVIKDVSPFTNTKKCTLAKTTSAENWRLMDYEPQSLYPGTYEVTLSVIDETPKNCPSIDYVQFTTTDASIVPVDPSSLTEDDIPDNDFHNLQQYKYLMDEDELSYKTYATGADLSAPRGMKLRYEELDDASKYYFQVAESESELDNAPIKESTTKYLMYQNAKLDTKYYYRAATSESGLDNADVKNITSTDLAPRVVSVPNVLNFRDIGGWESTLVPGAKINQGMYFRCAQLNGGNGSTTSQLDKNGQGLAAIKELGIKVDIDMRDSYNVPSKSPADTTDWPVTIVKASVASGTEPNRWEGGTATDRSIANQYKTIFETLANCDTAPVMLHCTYGADRTGIATFFLEALLGMNEEDMIRDYLWTQFTQGRTVKFTENDAEFPKWLSKTEALEGDTFADKMENHLISFGIAKSTLEHIREIFVDGYEAQA